MHNNQSYTEDNHSNMSNFGNYYYNTGMKSISSNEQSISDWKHYKQSSKNNNGECHEILLHNTKIKKDNIDYTDLNPHDENIATRGEYESFKKAYSEKSLDQKMSRITKLNEKVNAPVNKSNPKEIQLNNVNSYKTMKNPRMDYDTPKEPNLNSSIIFACQTVGSDNLGNEVEFHSIARRDENSCSRKNMSQSRRNQQTKPLQNLRSVSQNHTFRTRPNVSNPMRLSSEREALEEKISISRDQSDNERQITRGNNFKEKRLNRDYSQKHTEDKNEISPLASPLRNKSLTKNKGSKPYRVISTLDYVSKALKKPSASITNQSVYSNVKVIDVPAQENSIYIGILPIFFYNLLQDRYYSHNLTLLYEKIQSKKIKLIFHAREDKLVHSLLINLRELIDEKTKYNNNIKPLYKIFIKKFFEDLIFQDALIALMKELLIEYICSLDAKIFSMIFLNEQKSTNRLFSNIRSNTIEPTEPLISLIPNIIEANLEIHYMKENKIEIVLYTMKPDMIPLIGNQRRQIKQKRPIALICTKANHKNVFKVSMSKEEANYFIDALIDFETGNMTTNVTNITNITTNTNNTDMTARLDLNDTSNSINKQPMNHLYQDLNNKTNIDNTLMHERAYRPNIRDRDTSISRDQRYNYHNKSVNNTSVTPSHNNSNNGTGCSGNSSIQDKKSTHPNTNSPKINDENNNNTRIMNNGTCMSDNNKKNFLQTSTPKSKDKTYCAYSPDIASNTASANKKNSKNIDNDGSPFRKINQLQSTKPMYGKAHTTVIDEIESHFHIQTSGFDKNKFHLKTKELLNLMDIHTKSMLQYFPKMLINFEPSRPNFINSPHSTSFNEIYTKSPTKLTSQDMNNNNNNNNENLGRNIQGAYTNSNIDNKENKQIISSPYLINKASISSHSTTTTGGTTTNTIMIPRSYNDNNQYDRDQDYYIMDNNLNNTNTNTNPNTFISPKTSLETTSFIKYNKDMNCSPVKAKGIDYNFKGVCTNNIQQQQQQVLLCDYENYQIKNKNIPLEQNFIMQDIENQTRSIRRNKNMLSPYHNRITFEDRNL